MFLIYCPHCDEYREEEEFHPKGQAHISRPLDPDNCTDEEWGEYLFFRKNPRGLHHELWVHAEYSFAQPCGGVRLKGPQLMPNSAPQLHSFSVLFWLNTVPE